MTIGAAEAEIEAPKGVAGDVVMRVDEQRRAVDLHDFGVGPGSFGLGEGGQEKAEGGGEKAGEGHGLYCRIAKLDLVTVNRRQLLGFVPGMALAQSGAGLRLGGPAEEKALRRWIVWLAEALYAMQPSLPAGVKDCSGFVRFCYREALRRHDREWAEQTGLDGIPALPDARGAADIHARLGGAVFRVRPGRYRVGDERNGSYRHFADVEHLMRFNCYRVAGELRAARPGDLLFYRQLAPSQPFHSMVVTGEAVVYHTGPEGKWAGEVRRLTFQELRRHPQPRWRPETGNPNFLGVFCWTILERG